MADTYTELDSHYQMWTKDNQKRMTRKGGWNDVTDAYWGHLPKDWPFTSKVVDPCVRTSLIEKNSRLLNSRLRGRVSPRENADMVHAILCNALLDYQWDNAQDGGSMMVKFEISDMDTRLYGCQYAEVYWKYETDENGKVLFDGNELRLLDIRDCGIDPTASSIKDANWFQFRTFEKLEDLERAVDGKGKPIYKNLDKLKTAMSEKVGASAKRTTNYQPRVKELIGLEDRTGQDMSFPVVMVVHERRRDDWYDFCPDYGVIIRKMENPFIHGKINIAQLKYYKLDDEPNGESEVESVLGLWRAKQAILCAYMDEAILKIRPPLKVIENAARVETIVYGPEAQWLVDREDAITEMRSSGDTLQYFQTTWTALTAAFNIAMGDISQGKSNVDPFQTEPKTATEIRAVTRQQNARDEKNQNDLAEFITDIMQMWISNNKQFLFSNPKKQEYILRIVGKGNFARLQRMGLDQGYVPEEAMSTIQDIITQNPEISSAQIQQMHETAKIPKYPIIVNPREKDLTKIEMKSKMMVSDTGDVADVTIVPEDLNGTFDYIPDVKSMSLGASEELQQARQGVLQAALNPQIQQALAIQGEEMNIKEILVENFEGSGYKEADTLFQPLTQPPQPQVPPQATAPGQFPQPQTPQAPVVPQPTLG